MERPPQQPTPAGTGLVLEARLVHAEAGRRVVEASAWRRGDCLGRALGEAENAEAAEDRAVQRLQERLGNDAASATTQPRPRVAPSLPTAPAAPAAANASLTTSQAQTSSQPNLSPATAMPMEEQGSAEPDDWSEELAELDVQLQRLGWDRSLEATFLQRAFGHPSRSRLTAYADLQAYLGALRSLPAGSTPETAMVPLRRRDLLQQSDALLSSLGWDANQGRDWLERHFQLASRQQLNDDQLLQFNMLLEEALLQARQTA